ncbi:MAG: hypothetical protein A4E42_01500 [Methanoregulaceae archaeon PtaU1.Bin222]|nr:MAG: hypothetical protein A4E42_01500 [Methanoregulaceae archaeon PtaU1.Bin222]
MLDDIALDRVDILTDLIDVLVFVLECGSPVANGIQNHITVQRDERFGSFLIEITHLPECVPEFDQKLVFPFLELHLDFRRKLDEFLLLVRLTALLQWNGKETLWSWLDNESFLLGYLIDVGKQQCFLLFNFAESGIVAVRIILALECFGNEPLCLCDEVCHVNPELLSHPGREADGIWLVGILEGIDVNPVMAW